MFIINSYATKATILSLIFAALVFACSAESGQNPGARTLISNGAKGDAADLIDSAALEGGAASSLEASVAREASSPKRGADVVAIDPCAVEPIVLFVIDGSGSMCADFGGSTRWQSLRSSLLDRSQGLIYRLQDQGMFGMILYDGTIDATVLMNATGGTPSPACAMLYAMEKGEGDCPQLIEVPPAMSNASAIDTAFPATELGGSTPTDKAMNRAVDQLLEARKTGLDLELHPQYIILATDGQPNDICVGGMGGDGVAQQQGVIAAVDRAAQANISTFVISLAGGDQALETHLDEVARHGSPNNPAAHTYSPTTPQDLVATLQELLRAAFGCDII